MTPKLGGGHAHPTHILSIVSHIYLQDVPGLGGHNLQVSPLHPLQRDCGAWAAVPPVRFVQILSGGTHLSAACPIKTTRVFLGLVRAKKAEEQMSPGTHVSVWILYHSAEDPKHRAKCVHPEPEREDPA